MTEHDIGSANIALSKAALTFQRGIEREALRVDPNGNLSSQPHPAVFGSKLTHPTITTDFSEAQLELITPVSNDLDNTLETMSHIHAYVSRNLGDEILWSASMPCVLQGDPKIPLAYYGDSNLGKLKTTYRNGLGNRYGRSMQTICAVHYNFSFPDTFWQELAKVEDEKDSSDYRSRRYFDLMRNFRRYSWLPIYLFGASPAVCNSFVKGREHGLEPFDEGSLHLPHSTSLRSGNLGYQSDAQSEAINICYNNLENYVSNLAAAVLAPYEPYQAMGTQDRLQLNTNILQSEAEFYSTIRAKRVPAKGENFLACLKNKGVEYIEVRLMDIDPFEPIGITRETIRFLDSFLLYCLLSDSPKHDDLRCSEVKTNMTTAVHEGRKPGVTLQDNGTPRELNVWAKEVLDGVTAMAQTLDDIHGTNEHQNSLVVQQQKVDDPERTPSARVLKAMREESIPYFRFAMNQSLAHRAHHTAEPLPDAKLEAFANAAEKSIVDHQAIESAKGPDFIEYLDDMFAEYKPLAE